MAELRITATVKQFKELSGLGSTSIYELIKSGDIRSVTFGRRRLIIMESYREWLERRASQPPLAAIDRGEPAPLGGAIDGTMA